MASWGSYVFELCRINANQGLTAEIDWNYTSWSRRCRKILIGLVVRGAKTVVVRGKNRILTRNRKKPEMTVPISYFPYLLHMQHNSASRMTILYVRSITQAVPYKEAFTCRQTHPLFRRFRKILLPCPNPCR